MTTARIVRGLDLAAWRHLQPRSALHDEAWLSVMSSRLPGEVFTVTLGEDLGFCAVLVSDPDAYEAYNPYAVLWREPPVFALPGRAWRAAGLTDLDRGSGSTLPALVLVAPGYLGDPAGHLADDPDAVERLIRQVSQWCAATGVVSLHILYSAGPVVAGVIGRVGGSTYPITTRSVLPVWWDDWDGYLHGLPRRRRADIARQERRAREAGLDVRRLDVGEHFEDILAGRCALLRRYGQHADEAAERRRLGALAEAFGDRLVVYGAIRSREVVTCAVCVVNGRSMHVVYTGSSDAAQTLPFAHFLATFHGPIQSASRNALDEIDYGIGHSDGKVFRGCRSQQLFGHVIGIGTERQSLLGQASRLLAAAYRPTEGSVPQPSRAAGPVTAQGKG